MIAILERRMLVPNSCLKCSVCKSETRSTADGYFFCGDHGDWVDRYYNERHPDCNLKIVEGEL
jgi:hypothetical protein